MGHVLGAERPALSDTAGPQRTLLAGVDPRSRILAAIAFSIVIVALEDMSLLCIGLAAAMALMLAARLPVAATLKRMAAMDSFIVFLIAMLPFTVPGEPIFTLFGFAASWEGLWQAVAIALKANAVILALMALVGSMEPVTLGHALSRLKMPEGLVHLLMFTVRYIDVLHQEYQRLRLAMKARGFQPATNHHTLRSLGYLLGMMLVRAIERSERVLAAMKCRGFTGRIPLLDELAFSGRDLLFAAGFTAFLGALVALQLSL
ncbi:cobalt ECF transporter T component CbiQ [Afifella sp. IM 167]|uniref:cobalt ECF transporter T component CbiQ n=1 Tax=Afifella sp. IM 167 TaxID=2033586 RepID=UPI001CCAD2D4|nr:cobalt ECF transporter T component CbiQ [Afifella sp. IM 167]MBZ8135070.1 cobalt ECF transporter T component CbiQ [Afifella sp. IM 167]